MKTKTTFSQLYCFPGFRAKARFKCGIKGQPNTRVVELTRRKKKVFVPDVENGFVLTMTKKRTAFGIYPQEMLKYILNLNLVAATVRSAA